MQKQLPDKIFLAVPLLQLLRGCVLLWQNKEIMKGGPHKELSFRDQLKCTHLSEQIWAHWGSTAYMREANCSPISWKVRCISSRVHKFHSHLRSIPPLKTLPSFGGWQQLHLTPLGFGRNSEKPDTLVAVLLKKYLPLHRENIWQNCLSFLQINISAYFNPDWCIQTYSSYLTYQ